MCDNCFLHVCITPITLAHFSLYVFLRMCAVCALVFLRWSSYASCPTQSWQNIAAGHALVVQRNCGREAPLVECHSPAPVFQRRSSSAFAPKGCALVFLRRSSNVGPVHMTRSWSVFSKMTPLHLGLLYKYHLLPSLFLRA